MTRRQRLVVLSVAVVVLLLVLVTGRQYFFGGVSPGFAISTMPPACSDQAPACVSLTALPPKGENTYTVESVTESSEAVHVAITPNQAEDNDAAYEIEVPLAEPLGDRELIVNGMALTTPGDG